MDFDSAAKELLELPWATVLFLASGYAGYFVANTGVREHHKNIDVAFSSAVFGFVSLLVYRTGVSAGVPDLISSACSFVFAIVLGAVWRRFGRASLRWTLKRSGVSFADDSPTALQSMFDVKHGGATELSVRLKDGSWLQSCNLQNFAHFPNGPFVVGMNGDVLLYVTDSRDAGSENSRPNLSLDGLGWGWEITYLPASEVARIDLRRKATS